MTRFLVGRLVQTILLLLGISIVGFLLVTNLPGGPLAAYEANPEFRAEDRERLIQQLGLDQPLPLRYASWLGHVAQGDLGSSLLTHQPVTTMIMARLGNTIYLMIIAITVTLLLSIPVGLIAGLRHYSRFDYATSILTYLGLSIPTFWLGMMLIALFAVGLHWLPAGGMGQIGVPQTLFDRARHLALPVLTIAFVQTGLYARYLRAGVLEVMARDYVRTARAKGLTENAIVWRHVLKNALAPFVTVVALHFPEVVTGAVVTETVFSWPGMGRLFWESALRQDHPVLLGLLLLGAIFVAFSSLAADLIYAWLNPRVRLT
jgi:peptide/nickel transport system permease protein